MFLSAVFLMAQVTPSQGAQTTAPARSLPAIASVRLGQVAAGRAVASQNCQTCHAIGKSGVSPNPAAPKFRNLSRKYPIEALSESFAEGVFIGHSVMPQFEFSADKVEALVAYIKSVQTPAPRRRKK